VLVHAGELLRATAELTAFTQHIDDKILIDRTSQFESIAKNVGRARIRGVESGLDVQLGERGPRVLGSATLLETRGMFGRQLPLRPRLRVHAAVQQSVRFAQPWAERLTGFAQLDHASSAFHDRANEVLRAALTSVGCGLVLALARERIELAARVSDVFDARGQDYLGFPLPGRSFFFLARVREATP
jgi:outer membrane cobalamin receptor